MSYLFRGYRIKPGAITADMNNNDVLLDVNTTIPCGLIINELVSNSFKHAFTDGREGVITIAIHPIRKMRLNLLSAMTVLVSQRIWITERPNP